MQWHELCVTDKYLSSLCSVCDKAFVTMGKKHGHIDEAHAEATQVYAKLEKGTCFLHLPGVQASLSPSRIYNAAPAGV
jgi:hypothetical protein